VQDRRAGAGHSDDEDGFLDLLLRDLWIGCAICGVVQSINGVEQCSFAGDELTSGVELRVAMERIHESVETFEEEGAVVAEVSAAFGSS
jgi:hypothetical protein